MPEARNLCYAQSGGVTAVINATAAAIIEHAQREKRINRVYAAQNGILGVLRESLFETWHESAETLAAMRHTPGGVFGSCRIKLPPPQQNLHPYRRLLDVFTAHQIGYFLYNGGNDSADTSLKIAAAMKILKADVTCIGVPKTIDNDLPATDCCPGFGSAAKYIAVSISEAALDIAAMARTSTKVFIMEVMGRHAGWLAAAAGLAFEGSSPLVIVFPETPFNQPAFVAAVQQRVRRFGYAVVAVSEGARASNGAFLAADDGQDHFSHQQLGGSAAYVTAIIKQELGYKCHFAVADYLQRSARHIASATDLTQAEAVGQAAVEFAVNQKTGVMPVIWRLSDSPYRWEIGAASLKRIANRERKLPALFIGADKFSITPACRRYLQPLIEGECYPPYHEGMPQYARMKNILAAKRLPETDDDWEKPKN